MAIFLLRPTLLYLATTLISISFVKEGPYWRTLLIWIWAFTAAPFPHQPELSYCWLFTFTVFRDCPALHPILSWAMGPITFRRLSKGTYLNSLQLSSIFQLSWVQVFSLCVNLHRFAITFYKNCVFPYWVSRQKNQAPPPNFFFFFFFSIYLPVFLFLSKMIKSQSY